MKFVVFLLSVFIGLIYADSEPKSGVVKTFGHLENSTGQPFTLLDSHPVYFSDTCGNVHVQRVIEFPSVRLCLLKT